jgi:uncharacterized membrane protein YqhA
MPRLLAATRYLILVPILGLLVAAALFFVFGGIGLVRQLVNLLSGMALPGGEANKGVVIFEVVEYVHLFLVGTVLYITSAGLYQLFVHELKFPRWLKIDSTEELETNLIGVTVVVLAVNFMGAVFVGEKEHLLSYGAGIALPIAALGLFVGLRAWSIKVGKETAAEAERWGTEASSHGTIPQDPGAKAASEE